METKENKDINTKEEENKIFNESTENNNSSSEQEIEEVQEESSPEKTIETLNAKVGELNDKFLRLYSEFDNYKKRTSKERIDLIKTAGIEIITELLPVVDDFERAIKSNENLDNLSTIKDGIKLVYNKLHHSLLKKGLEPMESIGKEFDAELHEAITNIPAPSEDLKNKILDEVEKGYLMNGKVIRYAKVVVGN